MYFSKVFLFIYKSAAYPKASELRYKKNRDK